MLDTRHTKLRDRYDPWPQRGYISGGAEQHASKRLMGTLVKLPWKSTDTRAYLSLGGGECQKKLQTVSALVKRSTRDN